MLKENVRLSHLTSEEQDSVFKKLNDFNDVFYLNGDTINSKLTSCHEIKTTDSKPIYVKNYRFPIRHHKEVERQMKLLEEQKII